jgi:hypothetical protein
VASLAAEKKPLGLELRPGIPFESWLELARKLGRIQRVLPWQIGDAVFYAESEYGFSLIGRQEMAPIFGLDEGTLEVYAWVAGRFTHSRRRENLSFSHHALLAAWGSDSEQDERLDRAEAEGWSRDEFRSVLRARGHEATEGPYIGGEPPLA